MRKSVSGGSINCLTTADYEQMTPTSGYLIMRYILIAVKLFVYTIAIHPGHSTRTRASHSLTGEDIRPVSPRSTVSLGSTPDEKEAAGLPPGYSSSVGGVHTALDPSGTDCLL